MLLEVFLVAVALIISIRGVRIGGIKYARNS